LERADRARAVQLFVFQGSSSDRIHRPGPEHFKLTRAADGRPVPFSIAYDRYDLPEDARRDRRVERSRPVRERTKYVYNALFKGMWLYLDSGGRDDRKDIARKGPEHAELHARARLEPGVRYCLTWACWPVGAHSAVEVSCHFALLR
jgi:hypothetical protein